MRGSVARWVGQKKTEERREKTGGMDHGHEALHNQGGFFMIPDPSVILQYHIPPKRFDEQEDEDADADLNDGAGRFGSFSIDSFSRGRRGKDLEDTQNWGRCDEKTHVVETDELGVFASDF